MKEVREVLEAIWQDPTEAEQILNNVSTRNLQLYEFEKMLEKTREID
jgi:hypothetical protein